MSRDREWTRREALYALGMWLGAGAATPSLFVLAQGCHPDPGSDFRPTVLSTDQFAAVEALTERILPATDTPGARDAGVAAFIDGILDRVAAPAQRRALLDGLADAERRADEAYGTSVAFLDPERQDELLAGLEREADKSGSNLFTRLKVLTLVGYYTSEVGSTLEHRHVQHAQYRGDIALDEVGGRALAEPPGG